MSKKPTYREIRYRPTQPENVDGQNAIVTEFYKERLYTIVKGCFEVQCPDDWDEDYFMNLLIQTGKFIITDSTIGVKPFRCSLHGLNYMNLPTEARVSVPNIPNFNRTLNDDAILIYFERKFAKTYFTFENIVTYYATKFAMCDMSINVNLLNTRIAHFIEVESKSQSETVKQAYDKISDGEPLVIVRKDGLTSAGSSALFNNVQNTFIVNDIQDAKRTLMNEFLTAIGINNANTDKKERVIESEVSSNNEELEVNVEVFSVRLKKQCQKVRNMFGIDFDIKFKFDSRTREKEITNVVNGRSSSMENRNRQGNT